MEYSNFAFNKGVLDIYGFRTCGIGGADLRNLNARPKPIYYVYKYIIKEKARVFLAIIIPPMARKNV